MKNLWKKTSQELTQISTNNSPKLVPIREIRGSFFENFCNSLNQIVV